MQKLATLEEKIAAIKYVTKLRPKLQRDIDDVVQPRNLRASDLNILQYAIWCKQHDIVRILL